RRTPCTILFPYTTLFRSNDITFTGTGPEFIYMVSSSIDNVQVNASWRGLQFINNCYLNRISSLQVIGNWNTQFDLGIGAASGVRSEEHTSELQSRSDLVC